jgi:hypothetical protein
MAAREYAAPGREERVMGTFAEGIFDNDSAFDLVTDVAREVAKEMTPPDEVEDIPLVMGAVVIHRTLVEHCRAPAPARDKIESLKSAVLELYDAKVDGLRPAADFKAARRAVIVNVFDDYLKLLDSRGA